MCKLKFFLGWLVLVSTFLRPAVAQDDEAQSVELLQSLVNLQRELLDRAALAQLPEEVEALRPRLQSLVFDYERFLREHPKMPEGFVSYSMLLGNPLLDERDRAKALLLKANAMNANLPVVKNQLGKYLAEDGKPLDAINYFLAAIELSPEEPLYHFQLGQLLGAARDDFLKSGEWTVTQVDEAMMTAFAEAVRLEPASIPYAYRQAEAYYDLQSPPWDEAMSKWEVLAGRVESEVEQQMMRLHQINILLYQGRLEAADVLLESNVAEPLQSQKLRLVDRLGRLRNPQPVATTEATPGFENPPKLAAAPTMVPEFKIGTLDEVAEVSSATIMAIEAELPPNSEGELSKPEAEDSEVDASTRDAVIPESTTPQS
jgi:tetratricopeptide (TPR) repeat protein